MDDVYSENVQEEMEVQENVSPNNVSKIKSVVQNFKKITLVAFYIFATVFEKVLSIHMQLKNVGTSCYCSLRG